MRCTPSPSGQTVQQCLSAAHEPIVSFKHPDGVLVQRAPCLSLLQHPAHLGDHVFLPPAGAPWLLSSGTDSVDSYEAPRGVRHPTRAWLLTGMARRHRGNGRGLAGQRPSGVRGGTAVDAPTNGEQQQRRNDQPKAGRFRHRGSELSAQYCVPRRCRMHSVPEQPCVRVARSRIAQAGVRHVG